MKAKIDTSGLEDFFDMLDGAQQEMPEFNKQFMKDEFAFFAAAVAKHTPVDTGAMADSYDMSEVRQHGNTTEADWMNLAEYASFVNYGTSRIAPRNFWETGMNEAALGRETRYQEQFAKKFNG